MTLKKSPAFDLLTESAIWKGQKGLAPALKKAAQATLAHLPASAQSLGDRATWSLLLTTDQKVHHLNATYRHVDKVTNVLSFPQFAPETLQRIVRKKVFTPEGGKVHMGDIAIASRYVVREAKSENKNLIDHTVHLFIHGLLHLFGYDHMNDRDASKMEKLEIKIMESLGRPNPYAILGKTDPRRPQ